MTWMEVLKLSEQEAWANDLAAKPAARDHDAKGHVAKLPAQEGKWRDVLSWQLTEPIRMLIYLFPRTGKFVRITIKLFFTKLFFGGLSH